MARGARILTDAGRRSHRQCAAAERQVANVEGYVDHEQVAPRPERSTTSASVHGLRRMLVRCPLRAARGGELAFES
jgi:hypothetical protein